MLNDYLKKILAARVYDVAIETPLHIAPFLTERLGNQIWLKREDQQPVYSFKLRGAYNKIVQLTEEEKAKGVITASAGNHAQGRSEEHTSELQSRPHLVCRLLLEKKKNII